MPVIGDHRFEVRVNVRPTERGFTQQNYGLIYDLSGIPPDSPWNAIAEFCNVKFARQREPCLRHG
jgi:hypothetical protein